MSASPDPASKLSVKARKRLVELARAELPEPGDPRRLMDLLDEQGLAGPEALQVLSRTTLAWIQLRDMRLERIWQSGYGWFLARNLILFGLLMLVYALLARPDFAVIVVGMAGAALYYLIVCALGPLRVRRHKFRRAGILAAYADDLGNYLQELESGDSGS